MFVHKLVNAHLKDPFLLSKRLAKQQAKITNSELIDNTVTDMLGKGAPIKSSKDIQRKISTLYKVEIPIK